MLVLTLRSDKPDAELGLYKDDMQVDYYSWQAHRQLAETIHQCINQMLQKHQLSLHDIGGFVVFKGPGSFTGLRIGLTVINALAYGLGVPAAGGEGDEWIRAGLKTLPSAANGAVVLPHYGAPVHITLQKK